MTITTTRTISTLNAHPWQRPNEDGCSSGEYSAEQNLQLFVPDAGAAGSGGG